MKKSILSLIFAVALSAFTGCAMLHGEDLHPEPTSDEGIAALATSRLNDDPMTGRSTLGVSVERGTATLVGAVPDQATRQRAVQILEGTPGIYYVRDHTRRQ